MNFLVRLILIPIGYLAGLFAAIALIAVVSWVRAYPPVAGDPALLTMTALAVMTDAFVLFTIIGIVRAAAEPCRRSRWRRRSRSGARSISAPPASLSRAFSRAPWAPEIYPAIPTDPATVAAAGIAGGLGYWVASGRWSGRPRRTEPAPG